AAAVGPARDDRRWPRLRASPSSGRQWWPSLRSVDVPIFVVAESERAGEHPEAQAHTCRCVHEAAETVSRCDGEKPDALGNSGGAFESASHAHACSGANIELAAREPVSAPIGPLQQPPHIEAGLRYALLDHRLVGPHHSGADTLEPHEKVRVFRPAERELR